ncbi:histidine phosphatase family protein, partial [Acidithiobacillus ferridurans]|nr:histidine phosphatase family protein [Acidithiobacillus ferridurans]
AGPVPILAVTHAGVIRTAVLEIRREPLGKFRQVQIANGSLTAIHWQDGRLSLADGPWVGEDGIYSRICTDPERSGNQLKDDLGA